MRATRTTLLSTITAGVLCAMLVPAAAHGQPATGPDSHTAAELAAAAAAVAPPAETVEAARQIRDRVLEYVRTNGTRHTFGTYLDSTTNAVVLETDAPDDVVAAVIGEHAALVRLHRVTVEDTSRKSDSAPFYGGAGIVRTVGVANCSSGFTVKNPGGVRFMVTAGHCFANGETPLTENGGVSLGTVTGNSLPSRDMELIRDKSYGTQIFMGGVDSSTSAVVLSAADPTENASGYCHSGRTTGERCGHTVTSVEATACTESGCKEPVIAYTGGTLAIGGDSGAPFFVKDGSNVRIRGMIIAVAAPTGYAEPWSRISARFGVTIAN